ncbi:hypothetical protein K1719_045683 [Acacia pycnantha]|nr:hypothetical protein K1719_045683 [Acacia pycnantha]
MKPFRHTLVVKLLGRQPSYGFMVKKLKQIWERKGQIDVFDLENDFYLVNFQKIDDYMEPLTGRPWVGSRFLVLQEDKGEEELVHCEVVEQGGVLSSVEFEKGWVKCNFKSSERHRVHSANKENLHSRERMVDDSASWMLEVQRLFTLLKRIQSSLRALA